MAGMIPLAWIAVITCCTSIVQGETTQSLNGAWKFINANRSISGVGKVPGSIYTDLIENKILGDPYYRYNDATYRWVSYDNWTYTRTFEVSSDLLQMTNVELWAGGIDTVSHVTINDQTVGDTNNMFRRYIFDIKPMLKEGTNTISVAFTSAVLYALAQSNMSSYMIPPGCPPPAQQGECHFNFIRKEAASFSWDWGPAFPTQGIWKNITIKAYNTATIEYLTTETIRGTGDGEWILRGDIFFKTGKQPVNGKLTFEVPELKVSVTQAASVSLGANKVSFEIPIHKDSGVESWWPNGHGDQKLYDFHVMFVSNEESCKKRTNIGFRTVELVQEPVPGSTGLSFYFKINDKPIFMKGSNWIPADSFQERITPQYLYKVLSSAQRANMNALRVWGGGVYESEAFYDLTDRLGIMIWQDFMYACALYPSTTEFLDNVRMEVTHQVRRLKRHPSITVWAGNNENEAALSNDWWHVGSQKPKFSKDYVALYINTIRDQVMKEDQSRPFVSSSPSNGVETEKEGWVAKNPYDNHYGDVHYYNYLADSWNWTTYPITRFTSEFGIQAWPSFESMRKVSEYPDWIWNGTFAMHRQHHTHGNEQMLESVNAHLGLPMTKDKATFFMYFTYMTQIDQAVGIKTEAELHRRMQSNLRGQDGMTMGSLYWQLNDIWQAPTWASIEYGGKWKMLQYYAARFFNSTLVSPMLDGDTLRVYYVDEGATPGGHEMKHSSRQSLNQQIRNPAANPKFVAKMDKGFMEQDVSSTSYTLKIDAYSWGSMTPKKTWSLPFNMPGKVSTEIFSAKTADMLKQAGCTPATCFFHFTIYYDQAMTAVGPSNWQILNYFRDASGLKKATLKVPDIKQTGEAEFSFTLTTDAIAPFVWLQATGLEGHFSDNGFIMVDGELQLCFFAWEDNYTVDMFKNSLEMWSYMDLFN